MPHKDSGTELAPCTSPAVGVAAGKVTARRNHPAQRLESIWQDLPTVPELPMFWWHSLQTMATQEGAKTPLNFRGAGVSKDQLSPLLPRQASQAVRDRQQTVH